MISTPGIYDMPMAEYHGNVASAPSMSASDAIELMATCPAKWHAGSYFNPDRKEEPNKKMDLGRAAHLAVLEADDLSKGIVIVRAKTKTGKEATTYQAAEAAEMRDQALAAGKIPLLPAQWESLLPMRDKLLAHPLAGKLLLEGGGVNERSGFWFDAGLGIWLKSRPDRVTQFNGMRVAVDLKTTGNAEPSQFARIAFNMGYHQQAAMADKVWSNLGAPLNAYYIIAQETDPPYVVQVYEMVPRAIEWGAKLNDAAAALFSECVRANRWPEYSDGILPLALPEWAEFRLKDLQDRGVIREPGDDPLADLIEGRGDFQPGG